MRSDLQTQPSSRCELTGKALDAALNPRFVVGDMDDVLAGLARASVAVLAAAPPRVERFGPTEAEHLHVYEAAEAGAPVHLFFHGGFWRAFSAADYAFVAPPLVRAGISVVVANYALCPEVDIDEIVRQARAALAWTLRHAAGRPVTVSGHSAGGHLAAMLALGEGAAAVAGVLAISGLFDLEPIARSWLQRSLKLTPAMVRRNSPLLSPARSAAPILVAVGEAETEEFRRQSQAFVVASHALGRPAELRIAPGRNHLDILHDLRDGVGLFDDIVRLAPR